MIGLSVASRILPGCLAAALAVVGTLGISVAQESPPAGWVRATVGTAGQYKTVWLRDASWCGKSTPWWSPTDNPRINTVTVSCRR
jgi:hypothetical protein